MRLGHLALVLIIIRTGSAYDSVNKAVQNVSLSGCIYAVLRIQAKNRNCRDLKKKELSVLSAKLAGLTNPSLAASPQVLQDVTFYFLVAYDN